MERLGKSFILIIFLLFCNSCAKNPVTGKRNFNIVSEEQEKAMGAQSDPEIQQYMGFYENPTLQAFITEKGNQMAKISHRSELPFQFRIVDSPVVNAFAVPGGYVYFTRGIMAHFNNEAEFAGVLGHEIGHVTARHSAQQISKQTLAQVGLVAGMIFSPTFRQFGDAAQQSVGLLFLKYGRDHERESDKLGVEYSTKIGYDAKEMAHFFSTIGRLQDQSGGKVPTFLSTHPDPAARESTVNKMAQQAQAASPGAKAVNRDQYLRMIDGMIYGEDPKQGFVENNMFYHPELKFQFSVPAGWATQNSPVAFQMGDKNGKAMMMLTAGQGTSLEAAAQATLKQYNLTAKESKSDNVNGMPALAVIADQTNEQGQVGARTLIYFIQYGGGIYVMLGASAANDFAGMMPGFQAVAKSFNVLTDQEKINRQPDRVKIKTASSGMTLSSALKQNNVPDAKMEEHAIINGMKLSDMLTAGMLFKVIEK